MGAPPHRIVSVTLVTLGILVTLAAFAMGCARRDDAAQLRESAPAKPEAVAERLGVDAADLAPPPTDPPPPAGDLRAELDGFTTLDACVAQHAALDPLVGDAIRAIGYETFLRDACRILDAAKRGDPRPCDAIDASALRARCQSVTAMVAGKPEACPWEMPDDRARGRDPACVAIASRDARLCAGAARSARATCEAIAAGDDTRCRGADPRDCRREAARWKRIASPASGLAPLPKVEARLTLRGARGTPDPAHPEADVTEDVARGVVLVGRRFDLGTRRESGATTFTPSALGRPRIAATVSSGAKSAALDGLEVEVPGASLLVFPGVACDCRVTVPALARKRGGEVRVAIDGEIGVPPHAYAVHAAITTFVRDIVDDPRPSPAPSHPEP